MEDDGGDLLPAGGDDSESDGEDDDGEFEWIVEEDEDDDVVVEYVEHDHQLDIEEFELYVPPERSGHVAVVDRNFMYVWGGYKVRTSVCLS